MAWTDSLITARDEASATLAQIMLTPKPSYTVHGHRYAWDEYQQLLLQTIEKCSMLLAQGLPTEVISQGM